MRTFNSIRNIIYGLGGQGLTIIISFLTRTIFIKTLGTTYLGVNGLFSNILYMLSLAELGVGSAITFSLYKPLARNDYLKTKALMNFYAKSYKIIGIFVLIFGLSLLPFLGYFINDMPNINNLSLIYLLYLTNTVVSYFFSYKRSLIIADQKAFINTNNTYLFTYIQNFIQIIILITTKNYILYLMIQIFCTFASNIAITCKVNKMYPYLKDNKEELNMDEKKEIYLKIKSMFFHRIGGVVVNGTDNVLISSFVGVNFVGLYSNYTLLIGAVNSIILQIFNSITASIGNLNAIEDRSKSADIFDILHFISFWIFCFCAIAFWILLNPFIIIWLGPDFILDKNIVILIILNFYINGMRQTSISFVNTTGLFYNIRYKPLVESVINIVMSIILLVKFGVYGVFLGTLISTLTTSFWMEPYIVYKKFFDKKFSSYLKRYVSYFLTTCFLAVVTQLFSEILFNDSFIGKCIVVLTIPNFIVFTLFNKTDEMKYIKALLYKLIKIKNEAS